MLAGIVRSHGIAGTGSYVRAISLLPPLCSPVLHGSPPKCLGYRIPHYDSLTLAPFLPRVCMCVCVCAAKTQERERNSLAWYTAINPCIYPSILWRNRHLVRLGFIAGSSAGYLSPLGSSSPLPVFSSHSRWFNFAPFPSQDRPIRLFLRSLSLPVTETFDSQHSGFEYTLGVVSPVCEETSIYFEREKRRGTNEILRLYGGSMQLLARDEIRQ